MTQYSLCPRCEKKCKKRLIEIDNYEDRVFSSGMSKSEIKRNYAVIHQERREINDALTCHALFSLKLDATEMYVDENDYLHVKGYVECSRCGMKHIFNFGEQILPEPAKKMIHPCNCNNHNSGDQCYNCLNGAHNICSAETKCKSKTKDIGLKIVVKEQTKKKGKK